MTSKLLVNQCIKSVFRDLEKKNFDHRLQRETGFGFSWASTGNNGIFTTKSKTFHLLVFHNVLRSHKGFVIVIPLTFPDKHRDPFISTESRNQTPKRHSRTFGNSSHRKFAVKETYERYPDASVKTVLQSLTSFGKIVR